MKTQFHIRVLILLLASALAASCSKDQPTANPTTGTIVGRVVDSVGNAVSTALISSAPPSSQVFSDPSGSYTLPDLTPGIYTVTASKTGLGSGSAAVNVVAGKTVTANIILSPLAATTGMISGTVVDSAGNGVQGAQVTTTPTTTSVTTGSGGAFTLTGLNPGNYDLVASKAGFRNGTKTVSVIAGLTSTVTITLDAPSSVTSQGLIAYYKFDGDGVDASGNGHSLTLANAAFMPSRSVSGQALFCDGTSTRGTAAHDSTLNPSQITVSLWVKAPDPHLAASVGVTILSKLISASNNGYQLWVDGSLISFFYGNGPGLSYCYTDVNTVLDNGWHSIVCTADNNGTKMYFDGTMACSASWQGTPGAPTQTCPLAIGCGTGLNLAPNGFFNGTIDDVRIYNRVLTSEEIKTLSKE